MIIAPVRPNVGRLRPVALVNNHSTAHDYPRRACTIGDHDFEQVLALANAERVETGLKPNVIAVGETSIRRAHVRAGRAERQWQFAHVVDA